MNQEIQFEKYRTRSADYHHQQIRKSQFKKFNAYIYGRYQKHIQLAQEHLSNTNTTKLLDIGCGDAALLHLFAQAHPQIEYSGVDLSPEALTVAQQKIPQGTFKQSDVYNLPFADNSFDIIISSDVIEHVNHPEKMLAEIQRVIKPNGIAVIATPIRYTEHPLDPMHYQEFFPQQYQELIQNHFANTQLHLSHNLFYTLRYTRPIHIFGLKIGLFRYLYNLQTYLGNNPFLRKRQSPNDIFTYMFVVASSPK